MIRLSDLRAARVKTLDGETLGRIHEVQCDGGKIVALACGPGSLIERLTAKDKGRRIPWACVVRISGGEVIIAPDAPQRISASRSRQGTRRPSGRRSKR